MCDIAERLEKRGKVEGLEQGKNQILSLLKWLSDQNRTAEIGAIIQGDSKLLEKLFAEMQQFTQ